MSYQNLIVMASMNVVAGIVYEWIEPRAYGVRRMRGHATLMFRVEVRNLFMILKIVTILLVVFCSNIYMYFWHCMAHLWSINEMRSMMPMIVKQLTLPYLVIQDTCKVYMIYAHLVLDTHVYMHD